REHLLLAGDQALLQAAVNVDPDQLEVVAGVRAPDPARGALPTRAQRPQRDPLADLEPGAAVASERRDRGRDLVALHARELRTPGGVGQLAGEEVVVRAADADRLGCDQHLAGTGVR